MAQYERVTGQRPNDPNYGAKDIHPVHNVSWEEAVGYLNELTRLENLARVRAGERPLTLCYDDQFTWDEACTGYRLPTEAEWEYAARAGTSTAWFFGEDVSKICDYANINDENVECDDGFRNLAPVETSELAPNPWGLYSMYGNVWEWTFDWYDPEFYGRSADGETINRSVGDERVLRGGSYWAPRIASSSTRAAHHPSSRDVSTGFRCARSTPAK